MQRSTRGHCLGGRPGATAERGWDTRRLQSGFTLTELLVGLSIATLLAGLALPAWTAWLAEQRVQTTGNRLLLAMTAARRAAIGVGTRVRLCAVDVTAAATSCGARRDWAVGWLSLLEEAGAWRAWRESGPLARGVRVEVNATPLQDGIVFDARGFAMQTGGGFAAGSWLICAKGARGQTVTLAPSGRARISTGGVCN